MFQVVQHSTWMNLILYQEGTKGNPNQPSPGYSRPGRHFEPSLGSASCPHNHVQGRGTGREVLPLGTSMLVGTWLPGGPVMVTLEDRLAVEKQDR